MADVQVVSPRPLEASDGRITVIAPAGTERIELAIAGAGTPVRVLARRDTGGGVRFEVQTDTVARTGADLQVAAVGKSGRRLGSRVVTGVHLLGPNAFRATTGIAASGPASRRAAQVASRHGGITGMQIVCHGSRRSASVNAARQTRAASTFKVPIVLSALARDTTPSPPSAAALSVYRRAITQSDNAAANDALARAGGGNTTAGTAAVNRLFALLGMTRSHLDGPFIATAGRSRKVTTAGDLATLGSALLRAAGDGSGPLREFGVNRHEARLLLGLMSSTTHNGVVRDHVRAPVANKAGWLDDQQNDLALIFDRSVGPCAVGIVTEGLSASAANAFSRDAVRQVLPLLRTSPTAPPRRAHENDDTAATPTSPAATSTTANQPSTPEPPSAAATGENSTSSTQQATTAATVGRDGGAAGDSSGSSPLRWDLIAAVGAPVGVLTGLVAWRSRVVRRRQRARDARRAARRRSQH